ncbi:MAG TPA: molybdopterin cofactor-binding domain-containing protein [Stellaceae bacterium]|nr:molybdopterin cofactor-binding domain-containing protein [Stellaceae bacterium]
MTALLSRRDFGKAAGALVLTFSLRSRGAMAQGAARLPGSLENNRRLDAWIRIDPEGTVTVFTGKVELGQGAVTALAQIAAEELDVGFSRIRMVAGDTARTPNEGFTSGSQSMEFGGTALKYAAAEARSILLDLAAQRLNLPLESLTVSDGTIQAANGASVTYWVLSPQAAFAREVTGKAPTKLPPRYAIIGRRVPRLDIPAKLTGGAAYVQDMRLPGMLFGRVVRPPAYDAGLVEADLEPINRMPGVIATLRDGRFLGIVAEREEQAIAAREALSKQAKWNLKESLPAEAQIHEFLKSLPSRPITANAEGDSAALSGDRRTFSASYTRPYHAHASIGPSSAVAQWTDGNIHVWSHTQGVFPLRGDLAKALKLTADQVTVTHVAGSGCYGHNGADDVALDAALLARAAGGRPVKVQWMRDDEFGWEPYGPAMSMQVDAALDGNGRIVDWAYQVWTNTHSTRPGGKDGVNLIAAWHLAQPMHPASPEVIPLPAGGGDRNAIAIYDVPGKHMTQHFIPDMPLRVSALRTLGAYANVFAIESFMDELAAAAGADPIEFRLRHLSDPRAKAVIDAAARTAGWQAGSSGTGSCGRGLGFAHYKNHATYVAVVAEVEVDRATGGVRVIKASCAADAGQIVNPDGLKNQMEGGIVQSTSWTLKEQVTFDRQRITSRDWESYPILTFAEVPEVEVVLIDRPGEPWLGAGEAASGPTAAAIANALAHATGARVRDLPLTPERVKAALS